MNRRAIIKNDKLGTNFSQENFCQDEDVEELDLHTNKDRCTNSREIVFVKKNENSLNSRKIVEPFGLRMANLSQKDE